MSLAPTLAPTPAPSSYPAPARTPAGVPTGGQFAASHRREAHLALHDHTATEEAEATTATVTGATPLLSLLDTGRYVIGAERTAGQPFHAVIVTRDDNSIGLRAEAQTSANLVDGLAAEVRHQSGRDADKDVEGWVDDQHAASAWLHQHADDVAHWVRETYGADTDPTADLHSRHFSTHLRLPPDATVDDAVAASGATRIGEVHHALRTGEFHRRMLDEAARRD